jgi:pimeloyl-ACP methyl ester carboxylesterase
MSIEMANKKPASIFKTTESERQYLAAYEAVLSLWPVSSEPLDVPTSYGLTHVNACGSNKNPPMVLLPGFGANSTMWFPNVAALCGPYRVYALDTPGQPGRSVPGRELLASNSSEWLTEVFDGLDLEKAHLVGVSLGGWLALNFAIHAPERADHVVMLDPAASFAKMSAIWLCHTFIPFMVHPTRPGLIKYFHWLTRGYAVNPNWGELMLLGILNTRPQPPIRATPFSDTQLRSVRVPVLVLIGGRSVIYNPRGAQRRAMHNVPNVQAEIIPDASHALIEEISDLVNARTIHFCQSKVAVSSTVHNQ